jgi:tRNA pseudouridine38-40 synthase
MRWLKLTVAYDGTAFAGWQVQPDKLTVQQVLESAWREVTGEVRRLTAAGRTDAGVHALGQVVGLATDSRLSCGELQRALNARLASDVAVYCVEVAPDNFHATHDARSKLYRYSIHNGRVPPLFDRLYVWHFPRPLDVTAMHEAGQLLVGRHDFSSFESSGSVRSDTFRNLLYLSVERGQGGDPDRVTLDVEGDGFLYNMVRTIVGTLIQVGRKKRDAAWVAEVLASRDRNRAGPTAPAQGLMLVRVSY